MDRRDCSRCLSEETARPELECRWCGTQCAFRESSVCTSSALSPGGQCPAPALETVNSDLLNGYILAIYMLGNFQLTLCFCFTEKSTEWQV